MRRLVTILVATLVLLVTVAPAFAEPPDTAIAARVCAQTNNRPPWC